MVKEPKENGGGTERKGDGRAVEDRRAAPVSKVFTILAKNKVHKGQTPSRHNWQQKPESPSMHSSSLTIGVVRLRLLRLGKRPAISDISTCDEFSAGR